MSHDSRLAEIAAHGKKSSDLSALNTAFAPGCFGSAVAFDLGDPACQTCVFANQCKPAHTESIAKLESYYALHGNPAVKAKEKRNDKDRANYAAGVLEKTGRAVTPHSKDAEEKAQRERDKIRDRVAKHRASKTPEQKAAADAIRAEKARLKRAEAKANATPK